MIDAKNIVSFIYECLLDEKLAIFKLSSIKWKHVVYSNCFHFFKLLIDDVKAKKIAYLNGLEVMGRVGILLMAKQHGLISEISPLLKLLSTV